MFTERRRPRRTPQRSRSELEAVADEIKRGGRIGLFPEGTSTNGRQILPFKSFYFEVARMLQCEVIPVKMDWQQDVENSPPSYFSGKMSFTDHVKNLLMIKTLRFKLDRMAPIHPCPGESSRELASRTSTLYRPIRILAHEPFEVSAVPR
ncbi:MAG: hypothetical protein EOP09_19340 [Proteobacteria bacterium]|nr:MAG: hypothetical protein EOP09_19340 [Pseudomonadota bacterium]